MTVSRGVKIADVKEPAAPDTRPVYAPPVHAWRLAADNIKRNFTEDEIVLIAHRLRGDKA